MSAMEINILCDTGFEDTFSEEWLNTIASRTLRFEGKTEVEMGILITGQEKFRN